jgi:hypothetical protein
MQQGNNLGLKNVNYLLASQARIESEIKLSYSGRDGTPNWHPIPSKWSKNDQSGGLTCNELRRWPLLALGR